MSAAVLGMSIPEILAILTWITKEAKDLIKLAQDKGLDPAQVEQLMTSYDAAHTEAMAVKANY